MRGVSRGKAHSTGWPAPFDTPARPFGCGKLNISLIGHSGTRGFSTCRNSCDSLFSLQTRPRSCRVPHARNSSLDQAAASPAATAGKSSLTTFRNLVDRYAVYESRSGVGVDKRGADPPGSAGPKDRRKVLTKEGNSAHRQPRNIHDPCVPIDTAPMAQGTVFWTASEPMEIIQSPWPALVPASHSDSLSFLYRSYQYGLA